MGIGNVVINVGWKLVVVAIYAALYELTPLRLDPHNPLTWVLLFFADDLAYYWFHRVSHESRFFWASHVVHHSSQHFNLSTALRQTWVPMTVAGLDSNRGAKRAREARDALGLGPRIWPCGLTTSRSAGSRVVAALPGDLAGACYRGEATAILWVNGRQPAPRQRFTLAHEFGHGVVRPRRRLEPDSIATLSGKTSNPHEIQANAFAAEFLAPASGGSTCSRPDARGRRHDRRGVRRERDRDRLPAQAAQAGVDRPDCTAAAGRSRTGCTAPVALVEPLDDRLAAIGELPYLSPSLDGSLLAAALRDEAAVDGTTALAIERITRPARR